MPKAYTPAERIQLARFCAYGFLKNQFYFEPFLILAFLEKGFSYAAIGTLIGFRAICVNLLEVPSGAAADVWGRRKSMVLSLSGYIVSFAAFALADRYWQVFPAMFAFAVGEAFRTGTHKAMIFDWLIRQGRKDEKAKTYGYTRSWSKLGSVVNVLIATALVLSTDSYQWVFWLSIAPYLVNIVNLATYPAALDGAQGRQVDLAGVWKTLGSALTLCFRRRHLRSLILENVCFEGFYSVAKEYLQPLLKAAALSVPVLLWQTDRNRTAILVAVVYAVLNLLGGAAARRSHRAAEWAGGEDQLTGRVVWPVTFVLYTAAALGLLLGVSLPAIVAFVLLAVLLDIWKPVFVSRFYDHAEEASGATTLSVANQSKTLSVAFLAPIVGWLVDQASADPSALAALWPVAVAGILFSLLGAWLHRAGREQGLAAEG